MTEKNKHRCALGVCPYVTPTIFKRTTTMNTKDLIRLGVPVGEPIKLAHEFIQNFIAQGNDGALPSGPEPKMFGMESEERGRHQFDTILTPDCNLYDGTRTGTKRALARISRQLHARVHRKGSSLLEDDVALS